MADGRHLEKSKNGYENDSSFFIRRFGVIKRIGISQDFPISKSSMWMIWLHRVKIGERWFSNSGV